MARGEDLGNILTRLKADSLLREVPMLALTESIDDETRARAFGADACAVGKLDLIMQDLSGYEVLERLAANPVTGGIPVLIITSKVLAEEEHQKPGARAVAVLSKSVLAEEQKEAKIEEALLKAGVEKPPERI